MCPLYRGTVPKGCPLRISEALLAAPEALPAPVAVPAAVHGEGVPVDVAAEDRVGEKGHRLRYVLRTGEAGHRGAALYVGVSVAAPGLILYVQFGSKIPKVLGWTFVLFWARAR